MRQSCENECQTLTPHTISEWADNQGLLTGLRKTFEKTITELNTQDVNLL